MGNRHPGSSQTHILADGAKRRTPGAGEADKFLATDKVGPEGDPLLGCALRHGTRLDPKAAHSLAGLGVAAGEEEKNEDGALQELAARRGSSHARDVTRHRGRQGEASAGTGPGMGTRSGALAKSPHVAAPGRVRMATPRTMAHEALSNQRPQGHGKGRVVVKGLDTMQVMAGSTEGKRAKGQHDEDDGGAAGGRDVAKIARPRDRRPSEVLVVIGQ